MSKKEGEDSKPWEEEIQKMKEQTESAIQSLADRIQQVLEKKPEPDPEDPKPKKQKPEVIQIPIPPELPEPEPEPEPEPDQIQEKDPEPKPARRGLLRWLF